MLKAGPAMAIQISKYQSAESSPASLKFATKCSEGRFHLIRIEKKVTLSFLKNGKKIKNTENELGEHFTHT